MVDKFITMGMFQPSFTVFHVSLIVSLSPAYYGNNVTF